MAKDNNRAKCEYTAKEIWQTAARTKDTVNDSGWWDETKDGGAHFGLRDYLYVSDIAETLKMRQALCRSLHRSNNLATSANAHIEEYKRLTRPERHDTGP